MHLLATRLRKGEDLKQSIEAFVKNSRISSATIISGIGSLHAARLRMAGAHASAQDIRSYEGPFEIVSLIGNLGQNRAHLHMSLSDKDGQMIGGHIKEGCIVHTTVELVLALDDTLILEEEADPTTGFQELLIKNKDKDIG